MGQCCCAGGGRLTTISILQQKHLKVSKSEKAEAVMNELKGHLGKDVAERVAEWDRLPFLSAMLDLLYRVMLPA